MHVYLSTKKNKEEVESSSITLEVKHISAIIITYGGLKKFKIWGMREGYDFRSDFLALNGSLNGLIVGV